MVDKENNNIYHQKNIIKIINCNFIKLSDVSNLLRRINFIIKYQIWFVLLKSMQAFSLKYWENFVRRFAYSYSLILVVNVDIAFDIIIFMLSE